MSWNVEWPNLESVSISLPHHAHYLSPTTLGILYRLVAIVAVRGVNTHYHDACKDPHFEEKDILRIAGCTAGEWKKAKADISEFFVVKDGKWRLGNHDFIRYSKPSAREALTTSAKATVLSRDGRRCAYCGTFEGPLHYDHLFPISKGGTNDPSNLVLACAPCNRAKSDLTLREWVARS